MKKTALALMVLGSLAGADASDRQPTRATLAQVQAQPQAFLDTPFEFEGRFHRLGQIYQPFYTQFDAFSFCNFTAWDTGRDLSVRENFNDHFATLYLSRQMRASSLEELVELAPYQRFKATGIVRSVFAGHAFVEVLEVDACDTWCWWTDADHEREAMSPPKP